MKNLRLGRNRNYVAYVDQDGQVQNDGLSGEFTKVEVQYSLGGYNYFSGGYNKRGYRVAFKKVTVSSNNGYSSESFTLLGERKDCGGYVMVEEANRYNANKLTQVAAKVDSSVKAIVEAFRKDNVDEIIIACKGGNS